MRKIQLFIFLMGMQLQLFAAEQPPSLALHPIHEAFIMRNTAPVPQEVIANKPPPPQADEPPPQPNARMIWISGYWEWVHERRDKERLSGTL